MCLDLPGATPELRAAVPSPCLLARVLLSQRDQYKLLSEAGELDAEPAGVLWHKAPSRADMPVVGDWVAARAVAPGQAIVEAVLPRRTLFARRAAGRREDRQPIAANIDLVFLVCGLDGDFNLRRLERYLTLAAESGASPVVVLNKSDLCDDLPARLAETMRVASAVPILTIHTRTAEGIAPLRDWLAPGRTVALLGSSGVGKSSIVNCLAGEDRLRTAEVRESDSRGRHTTTHRELIVLPEGGLLIDTPGMRELQLWAGEDALEQVFDEIAVLAESCRFGDCSHRGEPGCAVQLALDNGTLAAERWQSYLKLRSEVRRHESMADPLLAAQQKRKLRNMHQSIKEIYKLRKHRP
jgi:ribosome biogenesis GTPase